MSELFATAGIATVARVASDIATVVTTDIASVATTIVASARIGASVAASSGMLEAAEEFLEREAGFLAKAVGFARIATGVAAIAATGIATCVATGDFTARIATAIGGEQAFKTFSETVFPGATVVATEGSARVARIALSDVTRRACNDTVTGATFDGARLACNKILQTRKQVARFAASVA